MFPWYLNQNSTNRRIVPSSGVCSMRHYPQQCYLTQWCLQLKHFCSPVLLTPLVINFRLVPRQHCYYQWYLMKANPLACYCYQWCLLKASLPTGEFDAAVLRYKNVYQLQCYRLQWYLITTAGNRQQYIRPLYCHENICSDCRIITCGCILKQGKVSGNIRTP